MRAFLLTVALLCGALAAAPVAAVAQGAGTEAAQSGKRAKAARSKREPTAAQMAARERQRKCSAEWKEAKSKGATGGMKWPRFYSQCNARLKGNSA